MKNPTLYSAYIILFFASLTCQAQNPQLNDDLQERMDMKLLTAVYEGNLEDAMETLALGANSNARDYLGMTALMYALYADNDEIIAFLMEEGARLNAVDYEGNSVLMHALMAGREEFIYRYIQDFSLINNANAEGHTAMILAARTFDVEMVELLYSHDASIHASAKDGTTPLMHATAFGNFYIVDFLAYLGAQVNHQASDGSTALHLAAWYGQNEIAGLLLDWGADPEMKDNRGNTPLLIAVYGLQLETTWYLIESGSLLSVQNQAGYTPLDLAAALDDSDIADLLLQYDISESQKSDKRKSALAYAFYRRNVKVQKKLSDRGLQPQGLYFSELGVYQGFDFNGDDLMYHAGISLFESRFKVLLRLNYLTRIRAKKLWVSYQENSFYQFHERRSMLSMGIYRELILLGKSRGVKMGLRPGLETTYSFASYRGTSIEAPAGLHLIPVGDILFHFKNISVYAGYNFYDTRQSDTSPNRFRAGIEWRFSLIPKNSTRYVPVIQ